MIAKLLAALFPARRQTPHARRRALRRAALRSQLRHAL
jgi:hypothetical protein